MFIASKRLECQHELKASVVPDIKAAPRGRVLPPYRRGWKDENGRDVGYPGPDLRRWGIYCVHRNPRLDQNHSRRPPCHMASLRHVALLGCMSRYHSKLSIELSAGHCRVSTCLSESPFTRVLVANDSTELTLRLSLTIEHSAGDIRNLGSYTLPTSQQCTWMILPFNIQ